MENKVKLIKLKLRVQWGAEEGEKKQEQQELREEKSDTCISS